MLGREHPVTRLEGFSDAVFGFALTLLVVSLEVPRDHTELMRSVRGFVPFALMFAMICWIWYEHNVFFRRYGLEDRWTIFLNCVLLFVVLFYVYPLKYLTTTLVDGFSGQDVARLQAMDGQKTMLLYSTGIVLIFLTFVLLHLHAWRRREALGLDQVEQLVLRHSTRAHLISMSVGVVSLAIAWASAGLSWVAGVIYMAMGPLHGVNGYLAGRAQETLRASLQVQPTRAAAATRATISPPVIAPAVPPPATTGAADPPTA